MRFYTSILLIAISFISLGCSYKTYQPIVFSDLDKTKKIIEEKNGYTAYLTLDDRLLLDDKTTVETQVGEFFIQEKNRKVYTLITQQDTTYLSNRHIKFKNVHNFRDMGGIKTRDDKQIIWGHFFRSGQLSKLKTKEDVKIKALGVKTIIDLRTDRELAKKPDRVPQGIIYKNVQVYEDSEDMFTKTRQEVLKGKITPVQADSLVMEFYKLYMTVNPSLVKGVMEDVFESEDAVLFHCSAGKDRTGMMGALILSILDVDRETIISEYMLSNNYRKQEVEKLLKLAKVGKIIYPKVNYQVIENFSWIKPIYIEAMFKGIEQKYGSVENYITEELGISKEKRQLYKDKYTY